MTRKPVSRSSNSSLLLPSSVSCRHLAASPRPSPRSGQPGFVPEQPEAVALIFKMFSGENKGKFLPSSLWHRNLSTTVAYTDAASTRDLARGASAGHLFLSIGRTSTSSSVHLTLKGGVLAPDLYDCGSNNCGFWMKIGQVGAMRQRNREGYRAEY